MSFPRTFATAVLFVFSTVLSLTTCSMVCVLSRRESSLKSRLVHDVDERFGVLLGDRAETDDAEAEGFWWSLRSSSCAPSMSTT